MEVLSQYLLLLGLCLLYSHNAICMDVTFGCADFGCSTNELCYVEKVSCVAEPCPPGLPTCIDRSKVCKDSNPVIDGTGGLVTCDSTCGSLQECIDGFCCNSTSFIPSVTPDLDFVDVDTNVDGNIPPPFIFENDDKTDSPACTPCAFTMCGTNMVTCPKHEDAICTQDNCSCVFWFVNSQGQMLDDCAEPAENPDLPIEFPPSNPPPTSSVSSRSTTSTKSPTNTLKSHNDPPKDDTWKYVLIVVCGAAVLCFIAFIAYKMAIRRRKQQQDALNQEQKVPLSQVVSSSPDNNNLKSTAPIVNGNNDNAAASGSEKM